MPDVTEHNVRSAGDTPVRKRRKQRRLLSCAECRRLKLKCDRQVPCAHCLKRGCSELCPDGTRLPAKDVALSHMQDRLAALETLLSSSSSGSVPEPSDPSLSSFGTRNDRPITPASPLSSAISGNTGRARPVPSPAVHQPDQTPFQLFSEQPSSSHLAGENSDAPDPFPQMRATTSSSGPVKPPDSTFPSLRAVNFAPLTEAVAGPSTVSPSQNLFESSPNQQSYGTLLIGKGGRSKYLGPTAAAEWLKDQEIHETSETPFASRMPSPRLAPASNPFELSLQTTFPFDSPPKPWSSSALADRLPPRHEANVLVESYFRYFAWNYSVVSRESLESILDSVYDRSSRSSRPPLQAMALVYIILALGALESLELPSNDPSAEEFAALSRICLAKGNFMTRTALTGIQALHIMGHYCLETDKGRNGDSAWPLWGLSLRLIQAMGLHRDGARWNLPYHVVQERRRIFWESYAADTFQANCFSRPSAMKSDHHDTALPDDPGPTKSFYTLKFELCQISSKILDQAMKARAPEYSEIQQLHRELVEFESAIPFDMRCRVALQSLPSLYPDAQQALRESPPVGRDLPRTMQQFGLAILVSETNLFLHRPYFARALYDSVEDPIISEYGQSFLTVLERCNVIINLVAQLHALHRAISVRHWNLWYHAFNAAVCVGTFVLKSPLNPMANFAMTQIDLAINTCASAVSHGCSARVLQNLQWLLRLRSRATRKLKEATGSAEVQPNDPTVSLDMRVEGEDEDVNLLGWRTRLIERAAAGQDHHRARTIFSSADPNPGPNTPSSSGKSPESRLYTTVLQTLQQQLDPVQGAQQVGSAGADATSAAPVGEANSTDSLLHEFWNPMMLQDTTAYQGQDLMNNWWDFPIE